MATENIRQGGRNSG